MRGRRAGEPLRRDVLRSAGWGSSLMFPMVPLVPHCDQQGRMLCRAYSAQAYRAKDPALPDPRSEAAGAPWDGLG